MKRALVSLMASVLLMTTLILPTASADWTDPDTLLPVDIVLNQEALEIRKVYDLSPTTDPSTLPREAFDRDNCRYECSDILREVVIGSEAQKVTQTETVESSDKSMETILGLLPQEKVVTTEDGFEGTLYLDLDSIHTEPSGSVNLLLLVEVAVTSAVAEPPSSAGGTKISPVIPAELPAMPTPPVPTLPIFPILPVLPPPELL